MPVKYLSPAVFVALTAIIVIFSVNNLDPVELDPWPVAAPVGVPVFLVVIVIFLVGFFAGALTAWFSGFPGRRRAAKNRREANKLKREIGTLKTTGRPDRIAGPASQPAEPE